MPLHLLHHKSYHVYSAANIERVRRDEAAAKAKEEAEEQRMQEVDAERRMQILRQRAAGVTTAEGVNPPVRQAAAVNSITGSEQRGRTRREEAKADLQFRGSPAMGNSEIAVLERGRNNDATLDTTITVDERNKRRGKATTGAGNPHASLYGADGHINLFASLEEDPGATTSRSRRAEKNEEYEAEKRAKEEKLEAQYTIALGKPADELRPWYSTLDKVGEKQERKSSKQTEWERKKEERRKERGDPLVGMRRGARAVKEVEQSRREWKTARAREMDGLPKLDLKGRDSGSRVGKDREDLERRKRGRSRSRDGEHWKRRDADGTLDNHKRSRHRRSQDGERNHSSRSDRRRDSSADSGTQRRHRQHGARSRSKSPPPGREKQRSSRSPRRHRRSPDGRDEKAAVIEKLRAERDKREKAERDKAAALIREETENRAPGWKPVEGGRYSRQFGAGDIRR
ncbi:hypothetical protein RUND412_004746 [Rhizina undulata]